LGLFLRFPGFNFISSNFKLVLIKPFNQQCLVGFQESLARESCNAQLLENVEQVHLFVQFVLGFLEKHIL
jgi:hypothetical protein